MYQDFVDSGVKSPATYADALRNNDHVTTKMPMAQTEKVLGAIRRAVQKYGSVANAKKAHASWVKQEGYKYADISNFKLFAPSGQRAKTEKKDTKQKLYETVSLNRSEANKRLASLPKSMRDDIIKLLGIK